MAFIKLLWFARSLKSVLGRNNILILASRCTVLLPQNGKLREVCTKVKSFGRTKKEGSDDHVVGVFCVELCMSNCFYTSTSTTNGVDNIHLKLRKQKSLLPLLLLLGIVCPTHIWTIKHSLQAPCLLRPTKRRFWAKKVKQFAKYLQVASFKRERDQRSGAKFSQTLFIKLSMWQALRVL